MIEESAEAVSNLVLSVEISNGAQSQERKRKEGRVGGKGGGDEQAYPPYKEIMHVMVLSCVFSHSSTHSPVTMSYNSTFLPMATTRYPYIIIRELERTDRER